MTTRLSALDSAFLAVESPTAHMHVGWAAVHDPPAEGPRPSFEQLRDHIGGRLARAPRYRQRLCSVPLGLNAPVWTDDAGFDVSRHVLRADRGDLGEVVKACMSEPLRRDRPLWQIRIAPHLDDGRIGVVGKAHHCMVDGIAAVELGSMLLDPQPDPPPAGGERWSPRAAPRPAGLLARGVVDLARGPVKAAAAPVEAVRSPRRAGALAGRAGRALGALLDAVRPATPVEPLNSPSSPRRQLAFLSRPLTDLRRVKSSFETKLNDVVLAASTGAMRRLLQRRGHRPVPLKTMVPVNVRDPEAAGELGNQISFMFVDLPCDDPDPVRRVRRIHADTSQRKQAGGPEGAADIVRSLARVPMPVQSAVSRLVASPRSFNLVVSNIPGLGEGMYLRGCELKEVYPVVPLADRHAVSIGVTNVGDGLYFGVYADSSAVPDADAVASDLEESIDELVGAI